ncbi:unnamed protein product [Sphagnum compactum]
MRLYAEKMEAQRDEIHSRLHSLQAQSMDAGHRLKDELEESKLTAKELQAAHDDLHTSLHALQAQGGRTSGRSSSILSHTPAFFNNGANLDEGKSLQLEEENLQLQTAVQELSLQNEHIRKVVGMFSI